MTHAPDVELGLMISSYPCRLLSHADQTHQIGLEIGHFTKLLFRDGVVAQLLAVLALGQLPSVLDGIEDGESSAHPIAPS